MVQLKYPHGYPVNVKPKFQKIQRNYYFWTGYPVVFCKSKWNSSKNNWINLDIQLEMQKVYWIFRTFHKILTGTSVNLKN